MKKKLLVIFGVSFLLKTVLILSLFGTDGYMTGRFGYDDVNYFQTAQLLVGRGMFVYPNRNAESYSKPSIYRTPGYPVFVAGLGIASGWNVFVMQLLQVAILSFAPMLLYLTLKKLKSPGWPAWIFVFDPITNLLAITFMTEGLLILFLLASFYCFLRARENFGYIFGTLILWSLAILIKPSVMYFFVVIIAMLLLKKIDWKKVVLFAVISCIPIFGWIIRNYHVSGNLCLSTQADNVIVAKIVMLGDGDRVKMREVIKEYDQKLADETGFMPVLTDNKIDFKDETKEYILAHPFEFIKYHLLGMPRLLFGTGRSHIAAIRYNNRLEPGSFYNVSIMLWYGIIYLLALIFFRLSCLKDFNWWFAFLFCAYNVSMLGIFAYQTSGALKRTPFLPFIIIIIALELRNVLELRKKASTVSQQLRCNVVAKESEANDS